MFVVDHLGTENSNTVSWINISNHLCHNGRNFHSMLQYFDVFQWNDLSLHLMNNICRISLQSIQVTLLNNQHDLNCSFQWIVSNLNLSTWLQRVQWRATKKLVQQKRIWWNKLEYSSRNEGEEEQGRDQFEQIAGQVPGDCRKLFRPLSRMEVTNFSWLLWSDALLTP